MQEYFNRYSLTKEIASESSKSVYLAHQANDVSQKVVLKVFQAAGFTFGQQRKSFLQRGERIKQLRHSSIVPILDLGIEKGQPYIVRKYLASSSLRYRLDSLSPQRLNLQEALTIVFQVGQALSYVHQRNILHGNVKPENIFFNDDGEILLADFGLAHFIDAAKLDSKSDLQTISYRAPEQFVGAATEKSDQYALACLAYELLAGQVLFSAQPFSSALSFLSVDDASGEASERTMSGDMDLALLVQAGSFCQNGQCSDYGKVGRDNVRKYGKTRKGEQRWQCKTCQVTWSFSSLWSKRHVTTVPVLLSDLPGPIEEVVLKAMAKDPSQRYANIALFLSALQTASSFASSMLSSCSPVASSSNALLTTFAKPLENRESEAPVAEWLREAAPQQEQLREAIPALHFLEDSKSVHNEYDDSKTLLISTKDTSIEAFPVERLSQPKKRSASTLWLAFALSGLALLLGTMIFYALVPLRSPASPKPRQGNPIVHPSLAPPTVTIQPPARITPTPAVIPTFPATPTPVMLRTTTIDDRIQGTGINQFHYVVGRDWGHTANFCQGNPCEYNNNNSWDNTSNDSVTLTFTGVQIKFYGVLDPSHGIGAISMDGGSETLIDYYAASRAGDQLMWTSPMLPQGTHTFKLRVTGTKNPHSSNTIVTVDRIDVLS